jgi:type IV pilus assembly protein PilE
VTQKTPSPTGFPVPTRPSRAIPPSRRVARPAAGFTLVELVVTVIIASLLAALAVASYRTYTLQAKRASAVTTLTDAASRQEQFFLNNRSYTATLGAGGLNVDASVERGAYLVSIDAPTASCPISRCWAMRATPQGVQTEDDCGTLIYNSDGERTPAGCW